MTEQFEMWVPKMWTESPYLYIWCNFWVFHERFTGPPANPSALTLFCV
jgi:hypothetical protein